MNSKLLHILLIMLLLSAILPGAGSSRAADGDLEDYTYQLTQSTPAYQFWTAPPSERVFKDSPVPALTGSEVKLYAAQNVCSRDSIFIPR